MKSALNSSVFRKFQADGWYSGKANMQSFTMALHANCHAKRQSMASLDQ